VNGNGINDLSVFYQAIGGGGLHTQIYKDNTSDQTDITPPEYWGSQATPIAPLERGTRFVDINADGKADVVRGYWNYMI
jgi:hypothetical protein